MPSNTQELLKTIDGSLGTLSKSMGTTEQRMYSKTLMNIKDLEYDVSNRLIQNTHNTKILGDVKRDLDKILRSPGYKNAVVKFGKSYDIVSKVQNEWFSSMVEDFKPSGAVNVAQRTATRQMVDNLVGGGVSQAVSQKVGNAILQNMQSGGTIAQVNNMVRELLIGDKSTPGRLTAYSGQIATDGINQYARAYNLQVTEDLGFEWYEYVGSTKDTTRPFCNAAVKQRWLHKSELGNASKGILRVGKVSTEGFYSDMTINKFLLTAGGYRCGHQLRGTNAKRVPASVRNLFEVGNNASSNLKKFNLLDEKESLKFYNSLPRDEQRALFDEQSRVANALKQKPQSGVIKEKVNSINNNTGKKSVSEWEYDVPETNKIDKTISWESNNDVFKNKYPQIGLDEKSISRDKLERVFIYGQDGKRFAFGRGDESQVVFPQRMMRKIPGGTIYTHNHPSGVGQHFGSPMFDGKAFSLADVSVGSNIRSREIRVVVNDTTRILRRSKGNLTRDYFERVVVPSYQNADKLQNAKYWKMIRNDDISMEYANFTHADEVWKRVANEIDDLIYLKF